MDIPRFEQGQLQQDFCLLRRQRISADRTLVFGDGRNGSAQGPAGPHDDESFFHCLLQGLPYGSGHAAVAKACQHEAADVLRDEGFYPASTTTGGRAAQPLQDKPDS